MKTSIKTLICALALSTSVAFAGPGSDAKKPSTFATGIYSGKNGTLNVSIQKKAAAFASVAILDANGDVLVRESLSKKQTGATFRFDVNSLQDGEYSIKVMSKGEKEVTPFTISSEKAVSARTLRFE